MVLPFVFWKFFFHNFKVPKPYVASTPKRVLTPKIIAKSQNVQARKNETKNAPPNYNFYQLQQTKQNANLVKTQLYDTYN
jgi:hypothetical protein